MVQNQNMTHVIAYQRDEALYNLFFGPRSIANPTVDYFVEEAKKLQGQGADIDMICKGTTGTLLINAVKTKRFNEAIALLMCGAKVHAKNDEGENAFSCACDEYLEIQKIGRGGEVLRSEEEVMVLLARCGANIHEHDKKSTNKEYMDLIKSPATKKRLRLAAEAYKQDLKKIRAAKSAPKTIPSEQIMPALRQILTEGQEKDVRITVKTDPHAQTDFVIQPTDKNISI